MKKILVFSIILFCFYTLLSAQNICRLGMRYQKSSDINWGLGYPVVVDVLSGTSAEKAGLNVSDIIIKIDDIETNNLNEEQINQLLQSDKSQILLEIKNLKGVHKTILEKDCHRADAISEAQLAEAFSFYSLRDANDIRITYPIKKEGGKSFSFDNVKTFSFISRDGVYINSQDSVIYRVISNILSDKGLKEVNSQSDIMIDIFYNLSEQSNDTDNYDDIIPFSYRYDFSTKNIVRLPILSIGIPKSISPYIVSFGISVFDSAKSSNIIWSASSEDLLTEPISIDKYASNILPLMLREFPFICSIDYPQYLFSHRHYNYTGIRYTLGKINHISEVDDFSPAYDAGIRAGDNLVSINGVTLNVIDETKIKDDYINFIKQTDEYREPLDYRFTNSDGITNCRYWSENKFADIANIFNSDEYNTPFRYLFYFRNYINNTNRNDILFEIERNKEIYSVLVKPIEKEYTNITIE